MISKEEFVVIHALRSQGLSIRQISKILGLNRRTVSRRLKEEDLKPYPKRSYTELLSNLVYGITYPLNKFSIPFRDA